LSGAPPAARRWRGAGAARQEMTSRSDKVGAAALLCAALRCSAGELLTNKINAGLLK